MLGFYELKKVILMIEYQCLRKNHNLAWQNLARF